jgi:hypothetical protein
MSKSPNPKQTLSILLLLIIGVLNGGCGEQSVLPGEIRGRSENSAEFLEEFFPGQIGNWVFERDDVGSTEVVNDQLVVTINSPNTIQFTSLSEPRFENFLLEVDAWQRSGSSESSYGVLFRMKDNQQFYRFEVTGTGLYMIERRNSDGSWTRLVPEWTPTAALNKGLNVPNRLKIIATGPDMAFYANDILLTQVSDDQYSEGMVGLDAGTFSGGSAQVSFDNLKIIPDTP